MTILNELPGLSKPSHIVKLLIVLAKLLHVQPKFHSDSLVELVLHRSVYLFSEEPVALV